MRITAYAVAMIAAVTITAGVSACHKKESAPAAPSSGISWMGYTDGMQKAKETGKPVLVEYYTEWCKFCKMMEENTYSDKGVIDLVNNNFIAIRVNAEGASTVVDKGKQMTERDLAASNNITGYPTMCFFDGKGEPIGGPLPGYASPEDFKTVLTFITSGAYAKGMTYPDYLNTLKKTK